ncbi:MAG: MgtC/SapB family protein [Candidatus Faecivivens sp.]|nr:MgtC/SapB family protein [Oscillospiraceae bacterium]MDY2712971.1 MgtC/SapB family protein [Candidatus Faecivivens sp.]
MLSYILTQGDYLLRVLVGALCGMVIGYERESRLKMAGIRTHTIIAMAASLMVVVSKYGFFDSVQFDASRVAASVVSALGFLGAGIILNRKNGISGVTTAAGTWATLGIGMTIGAGMWTLGIGSTLMLLIFQYFFHKQLRIFKDNNISHMVLHIGKNESKVREEIIASLTDLQIQIVSTHLNIYDDESIEANLDVIFPKDFSTDEIIALMSQYREIASIDT